jgi:hypothetical protein
MHWTEFRIQKASDRGSREPPRVLASHRARVTYTMLLAMQRAVFIKAMPLRALGATAEQAVEICNTIERRVPELGTTSA